MSNKKNYIPKGIIEYSKKEFSKYIIDIKQNYNWGLGATNYYKEFASKEILMYMPAMLNYKNIYFENHYPKFLDLGCGLGPMAFAYKLFFDDLLNNQISYVGIDINKKAINFLSNAYSENYFFHLHNAHQKINYVGDNLKSNNNLTKSHSDGNECDYNINFNYTADIQWSSSFFTHLTPMACDKSLNFIRKHLSGDGLSFNSWLIIDNFSKASLRIGKTDRKLDFDFGEYLSYSESNPLVCTAYKLDYIRELYKKNNFEIISILRGSWRGGSENIFNHYQDIIVSKPN